VQRRSLELALLAAGAPVVLLVFALVEANAARTFEPAYLAVPAALLAAFVIAHVAVRKLAPAADPGLLPIAFVLTGIGLAFVTRLDRGLAASQVVWIFAGVGALVLTLVLAPSLEVLARYKYTIGLAGIVLLVLPAVAGREINGAKLWLRVGGMSLQPGELAKIAVVLFLAAYLAEHRELLSVSTRRVLGMWLPPARQLGPLLLMWAVSLFVLVFERDLGSSLLLFAVFLVMLYAATGRASYVIVGLGLFSAGAYVAYRLFGHVQTRVAIWLHPFADAQGKGYQVVQSLFAFAAGGLTGAGPGRGLPTRIPFVTTDFIFSAIAEELGLLGAAAIVIAFLIFALRGLATASRARSDMAAFTATGLVASITVQAFVIVGGVSGLIPLTGITLPFISYGGSSILSTFIALALLLRAGDAATGEGVEMQTTSLDLGVLGRLALNRRLVGIGAMVAAMLVALVANLTWLQVVRASELAANPVNTRSLAQAASNERGSITARDGEQLAVSRPTGRTFRRTYPHGTLAAHTVGYLSPTYGRAGIEAAQNDTLSGRRAFRTFADAIDAAAGRSVRGNDVVLTLDLQVQKAAEKALAGRRGAVVVLDPRTGAVLASASSPDFDPNTVDARWQALNGAGAGSPLLDRSRQALYPPGSTFKVVTATGALGSESASITTRFRAPGRMEIGNAPVTNFEGGSYGSLDMRQAMARSANTYFAQLAVAMGAPALVEQAERFGFNRAVPYELPTADSLMPDPAQMTTWETAWAGVGQPVGEHKGPVGPQVTALEMALVSAGIANGGQIMAPHVVERITDPAGRELAVTRPREWLRATDPATAAEVAGLMRYVVTNGSGARASIPGVAVAGKTGTAEPGKNRQTHAWFIAFAPAERPTVAMAIVLEEAGVGGRVAAPAARPVLEAALEAQRNR
jgi:peptidoglycan glycosyltransferase